MARNPREQKPMTQEEKQLLEAAMSRFKWHRVLVADLKKCVRRLALDLCQYHVKARPKHTVSTGGFTVGAYGKGFSIQFVVAESDNELELNLQG